MTSNSTVSLRPATQDDIKLIFEWRNDPWLVPFSSTQKGVTWDEHARWFPSILADSNKLLFIIQVGNQDIGQIHFFRETKDTMSIGISIPQKNIGKGYGVQAIQKGCENVTKNGYAEHIHAYIWKDNPSSVSAFKKAGFIKSKEEQQHTPDNHICYLWKGHSS